MKARFASLLAACCVTSAAHASVLYTWENVDSSSGKLPIGLVLEISFTDAAVASGSASYSWVPCGAPEACGPDTASPVESFLFTGVTPPIAFFPRDGGMYPFYGLTVEVTFKPDGLLAGSIWANNGESDFAIDSDADGLFTVTSVHSDYPVGGGCDLWSDGCNGATGHLSMAKIGEVPEPASLGLAGLGLAALAGLRRRSAGAPIRTGT